MDVLTFIAEIFKSVVWPVSTLLIVFFLRRPLRDLLLAVRKLKWGELEAEFGKDLERVRDLIDDRELESPPVISPEFPESSRTFLLKLANASPRSAVLEAWRQVETAAVQAVRNQTSNGDLPRHTATVGKTLLGAGLIDDAEFQVFTILRGLRNRAAHESHFELAQDEAIEYAIMAQRLANTIESRNIQKEKNRE